MKSITNADHLNHLQLNCTSKKLIKIIMCFAIGFSMAPHGESGKHIAGAPSYPTIIKLSEALKPFCDYQIILHYTF